MARRTFTNEEKEQLVKEICETYKTGEYTMLSCCLHHGLTFVTFNAWCRKFPNINLIYAECLKERNRTKYDKLKESALSGLDLLLRPQIVKEVTVEEMPFLIEKGGKHEFVMREKKTTKTKMLMPNPTSVIFALSNLDADNFKRNDNANPQSPIVDIEERESILQEMLAKAKADKASKESSS